MRRRGVALRGLIVGSWMFILGALLLASSAYAAEVTASLLGTVRDASGAVVTGANISLTNTQTNVTKKTESGTDGEYSFTLIPVGQYRLGRVQTFNARTNRSFTVDDSGISGSCLGSPGDTVTGHFYLIHWRTTAPT